MIESICSPGLIPKAKSLTSVACTAQSKNELTCSAGPFPPSRLFKRRRLASNERMSSRKHSSVPAVIITFEVTSSIPAHQSNGASVGRSQYPRRTSPFQGINGSISTGSSSSSVSVGVDAVPGECECDCDESLLARAHLHASASLVAGSKKVPLINVSRYRRIMEGVRESHGLFSRNDGAVVAKDVQGERSRTPASGEGRRRLLSVEERGVDIEVGVDIDVDIGVEVEVDADADIDADVDVDADVDGCGCKRCERVDMQSVAPQESPARIKDEGGI